MLCSTCGHFLAAFKCELFPGFLISADTCDYYEAKEPTVHGQWLEMLDRAYLEGLFECSNCSKFNTWRAAYCPCCGAKMDLKKEGKQ